MRKDISNYFKQAALYFHSTSSFMNIFTTVLILVFGPILLATSFVHMIIFTANATSTITTVTTATVNGVRIQAGGGNATAPWTIFLPQKIEINTGESITWYNPTEVAEPHTVTFVLDNNTMTGVVSPLDVSNKRVYASTSWFQ